MPVRFSRGFCIAAFALISLFAESSRADLPPTPAPEETLASLKMADGLAVSLFASEPLIQQPVSLNFDDRGRMWVLQYIQYPIPNDLKAVEVDQYLRTKYDRVPDPPPRGPKGADRVTIIEDTDHDGRADKATDFLSDLNLASGMALGKEGVFVVQSPYLLFYPDRNHDDVPDGDPEVLLKGFGMEDAHAFANSLTWGPDGWLYGAQGSTVTANIRGIEFQQGIWRYHPETREFELFSEGGGNTWGIDFDRHGNLFAAGNTVEPLVHHAQGAYYVKGFGKHGPLHNPYAFGYFPPVLHHGYVGDSLTGGYVLYQADLLPERFHGVVIAPNTRHNAVRTSTLERLGSTFSTRAQEDFLTTDDLSVRPVESLVGPDGALYVADWCDANISHSNPKDRSQWYVPRRDDGRIWRVTSKAPPENAPKDTLVSPPLASRTSDELVDLLSHPNVWYSREARRILGDRRDKAIVPRLEKLIFDQPDQTLAIEAFWTMYVTTGLSDELVEKSLSHANPDIRAWTIRLLGDTKSITAAQREQFVALAKSEPDCTVRSQLACTAKRLPGDDALPIIAELLKRDEDAGDPFIPLLLWWAIEDKAVAHRAQTLALVASPESWRRPIVRDTIVSRLARRYVAENNSAGYAACAELLRFAPTPGDAELVIAGFEEQLAGRKLEETPAPLAEPLKRLLAREPVNVPLLRVALRCGLSDAFHLALDRIARRDVAESERAALIATLSEIGHSPALPVLLDLVQRDESEPIWLAALTALERFDAPGIADAVLAAYPQRSPTVQARIVELLAGRPAASRALIAAVDAKSIPQTAVSVDLVRRMLLHDDAELRTMLEAKFGSIRVATPREVQGRVQAVSQMLAKGPGDLARGRVHFEKQCATCHQLHGQGNKVGPDLTGADRKNLPTLLSNVIDPSAVIRQEFRAYIAVTTDGRILTGLLADANDETVTILDAKNNRTILPRAEVDTLEPTDVSLMPEKILDPLSDEDIRDLFEYIRSEEKHEVRMLKE